VIVPAVYPTVGGSDMHLVAFAPGGGIMADVTVAYWGGEDVTGGPVIPPGFTHGQIQSAPRYARAAIAPHPQGGTPFIVIPNRYHREIVGYTFCVGPSCSPHPGFIERFRTDHAPHALLSSPTVVPTGADNRLKFAVGTDKGVVFSGPAPGTASNLVITGTGFGNWIYAAPTVTRNGRVILALGGQPVTLIRDHVAGPGVPIAGGTFVQAASSRTHLFAATTDAFYTLDAEGQTLLANYDWYDGGVNPPAIGPGGYVYGMAANILFVFPPPSGLIGRPDREVIGDPAGPA
jgi:hypothetical protein